MMTATNAIHVTLITPSANSDAIRAQQQPTHQAPLRIPILSAPVRPPRHEPRSAPRGLRHLLRHTFFNGVTSYAAATNRVAAATAPPAWSQLSASPNTAAATTPTR